MRRKPPRGRHDVMIVATNPETLDGLQAYLSGAGIAARCTRSLDDCARLAERDTLAVVLFPDDFRREKVLSALADLAARRSPAIPILVTAQPQRFANLTNVAQVVIMPRPAWGWTILEAIRSQADPVPENDLDPSQGSHAR